MTSTPIPSAAPVNRQWRLAARPTGLPVSTDWEFTTAPVSDPVDGEFLVRVLYISLDPAMRGWMNDRRSYVPPVGIGEVMRAGGLGRVVASRHADFKAGDHVTGTFGVQDYAISDGRGVVRVAIDAAPLPQYLSVLGIPGMTAYFGLLEVGRPVAGETVVVSAAAGAVGQLVGPDREDQGLPRRRDRRRGGEMPGHRRRARLRRGDRLQERGRAGEACASTVRTELTSTSTMSAARSSTPSSPGSHAMHAWSSAARSRSTTTMDPHARAGELHDPTRGPRADGGIRGLRLRQTLRGGHAGNVRLDRRRTAEIGRARGQRDRSTSPRPCSTSTRARTSGS